jgi:serine/threonine protein kinase
MLLKVVLELLIILLLKSLRESKYVYMLRGYDYSVDLWSFGVVLYEICHGKVPFYGKDL